MRIDFCQYRSTSAGKAVGLLTPVRTAEASEYRRARSLRTARAIALALAALLFAIPPTAKASLITSTWNGKSGNWSVNGNWTPSVGGKAYPNNNDTDTYDAQLTSGVATLTESIILDGLSLSGSAMITGNYNLTIGKTATWAGGTMKATDVSAGTTTIGAAGTLTIDEHGITKIVDGRMLDNQGTINVGSECDWVYFKNSAVLLNRNQINLSGDNTCNVCFFDNATLQNQGRIDWSGGHLVLTDNTVLNNSGQINWSGAGALYLNSSAAVFNNHGTYDAKADGALFHTTSGVAGTVNNYGTFLKSGGSGYADSYAVTFNNFNTVQVNSGTLRFQSGSYTQTDGTTRLAGGNLFARTTVNINGGSLTGAGTVTANVANRGIIAPGSSAGKLKIEGNLNLFDGARLEMELGGTAQGSQYDYLQVTSSTTLDGYLVVHFIDGFQNSIRSSDSFTLLTASSLSGAFDNVANGGRLLTEDGLGWFTVHYGSGNYAKMVVVDGFTAVPEPGTLLAGALALVALGVQRARHLGYRNPR